MRVAIIPARGGSKRIPQKNIKPFHGKPLIAYSIENALNAKIFDRVIVTTDSQEIADVAINYGAEVPFMRDAKLSDDYSSSMEVFDDAIKRLEDVDIACMLYATAPLIEPKHLIEAHEKLLASDATYAFSATTMPFPIWRTFRVTKEGRCEMFWPENFSKRSQDLEEAYQDAGAFYFKKVHQTSHEIMFGKDSIPIILPRHLVQDIDTLEDFTRAELMYKALHETI